MVALTPISLPGVLIGLALCGFALWKHSWIRLILSLCIIAWGAWAISYDIKVAAPLISLGAVLFFEVVIDRVRG